MRKLLFLIVMVIFAMSSIGMCAVPDPNAGIGDTQVGYNYYNLKKTGGVSQGNAGFNEIYGNVGIGLGYGAFVNYAQTDSISYIDYGIKNSMLLPNVALMVGQRRMEADNLARKNNLFYGVSIKQNLGQVTAYGTYQKGADFRDENLGLTYGLNNNVQVNLSWKNYDDYSNNNYSGLGGGLIVKF